MRMVKRVYVLLPFLLILVLFGGQLPELLTFVDDTSNDFVEESFAFASESVKVTCVNAISQSGVVFAEESNRFAEESNRIVPFKPSTESAFSSPVDLLRLLSIQRK